MTLRSASDRGIVSILALGVAALTLLQSVVMPALPAIQQELRTDQPTVAWVLTAFLVAGAVATPIGGRLGDSYGKRRILVLSLVVLTLGSFLAASANSIEVLIAARVIQGAGAGIVPLAFSLTRDHLETRHVAGALGLLSAVLSVGFGAGLVISGPIADRWGYRWIFVLPGIVAAVAAGTALLIPRSAVLTRKRVPAGSAVLLGTWLVALLLALSKAPTWGWRSAPVVGLFAVALGFSCLWVYVERDPDRSLIDLSLVARRGVWSTSLVTFLVGLTMSGLFSIIPAFSQAPAEFGFGFGSTVSEAGLLMIPVAIGSLVAGLSTASISAWLGARMTMAGGCLVSSLGLVTLALAHTEKWHVCLATGLSGAGFGAVLTCVAHFVVSSVPAHQTGTAAGLSANVRVVGGATGVALSATLLASLAGGLGLPDESSYVTCFWLLGGVAFVGATASLLVPARQRPRATSYRRDSRAGVPDQGQNSESCAVAVRALPPGASEIT